MRKKLLVGLSCVMLIVGIFIGSGCELPGTGGGDSGTSTTGPTTGGTTGGTTTGATANVTGTWHGTAQGTYTDMYGPHQSTGILHLTLAQNGNVVSGTGWHQESGDTEQDSFTLENGVMNGNTATFTISWTDTWTDYSSGVTWTETSTAKITCTVNGNVINGTYSETGTEKGSNGQITSWTSNGSFTLNKQS